MMLDLLPWLIAMFALIGFSAFFSGSEAALFTLRPRDRRALKTGSASQRAAASLLADPERLLSAVLFWNVVINITYFAIASIVALQLDRDPEISDAATFSCSIAALLTIIFCSEMLPKSVAVTSAQSIPRMVGLPLSVAVRAVDSLIPTLEVVHLLSRRLIWPRFEPEPYMEVSDLERAIQLSTTDAQLIAQEEEVLQNIVSLSEIRADESMRPRTQFRSFHPPVSLSDLQGERPPSGYVLITDNDSDEVAASIRLSSLSDIPRQRLEHYSDPVIYVPWFATMADVLQQLQTRDREVAAVVNELGETIGILTFEDIRDTIFTFSPTRSDRLLNRKSIHEIRPGVWHLTGLTSVRRLARYFDVKLPDSKNVTVEGIAQEVLERLPEGSDQFAWGPFLMRILDVPERGPLTVELTMRPDEVQR